MGSDGSDWPAGGSPHPLEAVLPRMRARLADDATGLWAAADETVTRLLDEVEGLTAQVAALRLALVAEADRRGLAEKAGAASVAGWLADRYRRDPAGCGRDVKLARALRLGLDDIRHALATGALNADQSRVIARAVQALPAEAGPPVRQRAEAHLIEQSSTFNSRDLAVLATKMLEVVDPELADRMLARQLAADDARAERSRELTLSPGVPGSGLTGLHGTLDAVTADMLAQALDPLARPRPTDTDGPDTRSPAHRRGDAFHELLRRYLATGKSPTSHGLKPQLVITVTDRDLLHGTGIATLLHTGAPISTRTARQLGCDAAVQGTWRGDDGRPRFTDPVRLFSGRLRRLLELRDRGCAFPGCDRPVSWCDAHHILHWLRGGETSLDNGVLLCGHHHRLLHRTPWQVRMAADGCPEFVPPEYVDPARKALRNTRLRR